MSRPRKNDAALLELLADGVTVAAAARQVGMHERTAFRRLQAPAFSQQLDARKAEVRQRNRDLLNAGSTVAAKTLLRLLDEPAPPTVQLRAARAILEYAQKLHDSVNLEQRIAALEQRASEKQAA